MLKGIIFLYFHQKNKMERKVQILARVGKPSPPGEGANVVSTTGEDSRTDSDLRPSPAVFIRRGPRPLPTTALPHRERASHERDRNENDCGHRKYSCDRGGVGDFCGLRT